MRIFLYCRSSKERRDLSNAAQETQLREACARRGWQVVGVASDAEVSGREAPTARPGLSEVLRRSEAKEFDAVLCVEQARWTRDDALRYALKASLAKSNVKVLYLNSVDAGDSATQNLVDGVMSSVATYTSEISAIKGRQSMVALLNQKKRCGGKPPTGYRLKREPTGIIRQGVEVVRTSWELDPDKWEKVRDYLLFRSQGVPRGEALKRAGLKLDKASSCALDRRCVAGIYSGTAVWGVRKKVRPTIDDPRRRSVPAAAENHVRVEDAHPAIVPVEVSHRLAAVLATSSHYGKPKQRLGSAARARTLLGGIAVDETGAFAQCDGGRFYKFSNGRRIIYHRLDKAVLRILSREARKGTLFDRILDQWEKDQARSTDQLPALQRDLKAVEKRLAKVMESLETIGPTPTLQRRLLELEEERSQADAALRSAQASAASKKKKPKRRELSAYFDFALAPAVDGVEPEPIETLRPKVHAIVHRVVVSGETGRVRLVYNAEPGQVLIRLVLPEGFEPSYQP